MQGMRVFLDQGCWNHQFLVVFLLKQYPNYVVELLLQLTCHGVGTSGDDSSSWLRAVLLCQQCLLFIYNKECDV